MLLSLLHPSCDLSQLARPSCFWPEAAETLHSLILYFSNTFSSFTTLNIPMLKSILHCREKELLRALAAQERQATRKQRDVTTGPRDDLDIEWEKLMEAHHEAGYVFTTARTLLAYFMSKLASRGGEKTLSNGEISHPTLSPRPCIRLISLPEVECCCACMEALHTLSCKNGMPSSACNLFGGSK